MLLILDVRGKREECEMSSGRTHNSDGAWKLHFPVIKLSCLGLKVPLQADKIVIVLIIQNNLDLDEGTD